MEQQTVSINMTIDQCNLVLAMLAKGVFEDVASLILSVKSQAEAQLTTQDVPEPVTLEAEEI